MDGPDTNNAADTQQAALGEQEELARIAAAPDTDERRCMEAVKRITDPLLCAELSWGRVRDDQGNWIESRFFREKMFLEVRLLAMKGVSDEVILRLIALQDNSERVARAALDGIEDQSRLADIASQASRPSIGLAAVAKIHSQYELSNTIGHAKLMAVRSAAVSRLSDEDELCRCAKWAEPESLCMRAVERMTDESFLRDVAQRAT